MYTVWACLKAMTQSKTLKEKSTNKNHYDDNYNCYGDTIQNTEISTKRIFSKHTFYVIVHQSFFQQISKL